MSLNLNNPFNSFKSSVKFMISIKHRIPQVAGFYKFGYICEDVKMYKLINPAKFFPSQGCLWFYYSGTWLAWVLFPTQTSFLSRLLTWLFKFKSAP